jgi:DNA-binding winged helix-turn-helix (wHTH) protein
MDAPSGRRVYEFGEFRLDIQQQALIRRASGESVPLTARVFDTLLYLVEHPQELVEKPRLMKAVWPRVVVEDNNLDQSISALRRLLGEHRGANPPRRSAPSKRSSGCIGTRHWCRRPT